MLRELSISKKAKGSNGAMLWEETSLARGADGSAGKERGKIFWVKVGERLVAATVGR